MKCKICESESFYFANANILNKYNAAYFKCTNCGFVQTEEPYWLEEAYSQPIAETDSGLVFRNYMLARIATNIITKIFNPNANFLDYAAGYGLFVRLMRDISFNFDWYDKYCENIFAKGWEASLQDDRRYELITAFEVFEHFINPVDEINKLLKYSRNILFSTELLPENQPKPQEWWYYAPHEGQHISLYTPKSLSILAERLGLNLYSNGSSIHLLTEKNIPQDLFDRLSHYDSLALKDFLLSSRDYLQTFEKIDSEQYKDQWYQTQKELEKTQSQLYTSETQLQQSKTQLHQTQADFAQAQSQLHQTETELEKFQSQLHASQEELEQSQTQLHQTQAELEQSQTQLHQTQAELEQSQTQLHQTQAELEQSQTQLHQTEGLLVQSQTQLHQTEGLLEQSQTQLHQTEGLLEQSQTQLHQTEGLLVQSQTQLLLISTLAAELYASQEELEESHALLHIMREKLEQLENEQAQLYQTQTELKQSQALTQQVQAEKDWLQSKYQALRQTAQQLQQDLRRHTIYSVQ